MDNEVMRPEDVGVAPSMVNKFLDECQKEVHWIHSLDIIKDNVEIAKCVFTPERMDVPRNGASLSKSLTSIAIGFAIDEGLLTLDTKVVPMFKDELPETYDPRLEQLTIRNLLTLTSNSATFSTEFIGIPDTEWVRHYFSLKPYSVPGTEFHYDTGGMYILSCVINKVTGKNTFEYLKERLFEPLGINDGYWIEDGKGRSVGGWGVYLSANDDMKIARALTEGGQGIIPAWYVNELSIKKIDTINDPFIGWKYGYTYGFWKGKEDLFVAFGAFGQLWVCSPKRNMTVVTTGGCSHEDNQKLMELIQDILVLPVDNNPISYEDIEYSIMRDKLKKLSLPYPEGSSEPDDMSVYGMYSITENSKGYESLSIYPVSTDELEINFNCADKSEKISAGYNNWDSSSAYSWIGNKLNIKQYILSEPSCNIIRFTFEYGKVSFTEEVSPSLVEGKSEVIWGAKSDNY